MANSFAYTQINAYAAAAVPGQAATPSQSVYTPLTYLAGEGGCKVGTFVWADPNTGDDKTVFAVQARPASGTPRPLGLVERVLDVPNYDVTSQATDIMPENQALTIAVRGDYWVTCENAATVGQAVFVKHADGTIWAGEADGSTPGLPDTDYDQTSWRIVKANTAAGGLVLISNWANQ